MARGSRWPRWAITLVLVRRSRSRRRSPPKLWKPVQPCERPGEQAETADDARPQRHPQAGLGHNREPEQSLTGRGAGAAFQDAQHQDRPGQGERDAHGLKDPPPGW